MASFGWLWLAGLAGCGDRVVRPRPAPGVTAEPDLVVAPAELRFAPTASGERARAAVRLENVGGADLHVDAVRIVSDGVSAFSVSPGGFALAPGAAREVEVTFAPRAVENHATLRVESDDPDGPLDVPLSGEGAVPRLSLTPEAFVFPDLEVPCAAELTLTLRNDGTAPLSVSGLSYRGEGMALVSAPELPLTLAPGRRAEVVVRLEAAGLAYASGELEVASDDPVGPTTATQFGETVFGDVVAETFARPTPLDVIVLLDPSGMVPTRAEALERGLRDAVAGLAGHADVRLTVVRAPDACSRWPAVDPGAPDAADDVAAALADALAGPADDALLALAGRALANGAPGGCLEGLRRPDGALLLVAVSDRPEASGRGGAQWVADFVGAVPGAPFLVVSGLVDDAVGCGGPGRDGGYREAIAAAGGASEDVCGADPGAGLAALVADAVAQLGTHTLAQPLVPAGVEVSVDGVELAAFEVTARGVALEPRPPEGAAVEVRYPAAPECPPVAVTPSR